MDDAIIDGFIAYLIVTGASVSIDVTYSDSLSPTSRLLTATTMALRGHRVTHERAYHH
ncbi:MAG: hypothetical protein IPK60_16820 [Sandaracinaceae bacterium]|nr:hypothetical protein [Sandaracinaceae bacterium]